MNISPLRAFRHCNAGILIARRIYAATFLATLSHKPAVMQANKGQPLAIVNQSRMDEWNLNKRAAAGPVEYSTLQFWRTEDLRGIPDKSANDLGRFLLFKDCRNLLPGTACS
jgi:hypothetical protein